MRSAIFGDQYWRDATNDRSEAISRDVMQEAMLRDNVDTQLASLGVLGKDIQKKMGYKFKSDFPEAWYKQKEAGFLAKQALKDRQDLAADMAKQTYARMTKIFVRMIPDAIGLRPAFAIWKDWCEYDKSLKEDGGESYGLIHMSLMDVKDAVRAKSLGLTTKKLEASRKFDKAELGIEESVHEQVVREAALGAPVDDDVVSDHMLVYLNRVGVQSAVPKVVRIKESMPYECYTSPVKGRELGSVGNKGMYDLLGDEDSNVMDLQRELGLEEEGGEVGLGSPMSPNRMDLMRGGKWGVEPDEEKKGGEEFFDFEQDYGMGV